MKTTKELQDEQARIFHLEADLKATWAKNGDILAKKEGYTHLDGLEAIHRYIIDKHHWLPHQVRMFTIDDYHLILGDYDFRE